MLHYGARPQDKEYNSVPLRSFVIAHRHPTDEGRNAGCANYKARLNLRVA